MPMHVLLISIKYFNDKGWDNLKVPYKALFPHTRYQYFLPTAYTFFLIT